MQPVAVRDIQMVLLVLTIRRLGLEGFGWTSRIATSLFAMNMLVLLSFAPLRCRVRILMFPFNVLLFSCISSA